MNKVLVILFLGLILNICSEINKKKYPTKLFGIEIYDEINNYKIGEDNLTISNDVDCGYGCFFSNVRVKFNENSAFDTYGAYTNNELIIIHLSGGTSIIEKKSDFQNKCVDQRNEFIENIASLHKFSFRDFKNKFFINRKGSSTEKTTYTDRKYIIFKKNEKNLILASSCIYSYNKPNIEQWFSYWIEDFEITKKRMIEQGMVETKKLNNSMLKFDLTGL